MFGKSKDTEVQELNMRIQELTTEVTELKKQVIELKNSQGKLFARMITEFDHLKAQLTPSKKAHEKLQDEILKTLHHHDHIPTCELMQLLNVKSYSNFYKALNELEKNGKIKRYNFKGKKIIHLPTKPSFVIDNYD
jgi:seryl-tRNA synthetase